MSDGSSHAVRPHRGTMILVFGILGILMCPVFAIVAWVMGNTDLKAMAAGEMDKAGEGSTNAGKICGIIGVALSAIGFLIFLIAFVFGMAAAVTH
jgi:hypothetical protein